MLFTIFIFPLQYDENTPTISLFFHCFSSVEEHKFVPEDEDDEQQYVDDLNFNENLLKMAVEDEQMVIKSIPKGKTKFQVFFFFLYEGMELKKSSFHYGEFN